MFGWLFKKKREQDLQFAATLMRAAAEGAQRGAERSKVERAIATLGLEINSESDNKDFCLKAVVAIVRDLAKSAERSPTWLDDDNRFLAGIFAFTFSNALSYRLAVSFELTASTSTFMLISAGDRESMEHDMRDIDEIGASYNRMGKEGRVIEAIGTTFSKWLVRPTNENYASLVELYRLLGNHI